jgi:MFS family permease
MTGLLAGIIGQLLLPAANPAGFRPFCIITIIIAIASVPIALTRAVAPTHVGAGPRINLRQLYRQSPFGLVGAFLCGVTTSAFFFGGTIVPTYSVVMAHVNDSVGEGEFVAASGGLLIVQGVGAVAGPIIAGFAMSVLQRGLSHTIIAAQILMAAFGVYRLRRRAAPSALHKRSFVVEPAIPVATTLESEHSRSASPASRS